MEIRNRLDEHVEKAYVLASLDLFILLTFIGTLLFLICLRGLQLDRKSKLFIYIYLAGRSLNLTSWTLDLLTEEDIGSPVYIMYEFMDFLSTYVVTMGLYVFILDMLKVKIMLDAESLEEHRAKEIKVFKYTVIFLTIAVVTMISGTATIHLEMYNIFEDSNRCDQGTSRKLDLSHLVSPVVRAIALAIFSVRSI